MPAESVAWAWRQDPPTAPLKLLLLALAEHADGEYLTDPTVNELVEVCSNSRRSVQRGLRQLEELHLVELVEDGGRKRGSESKASLYRLCIEPSEGGVILAPASAPLSSSTTTEGGEGSGERGENADPPIEAVWTHYVAVMQPRSTTLDAEGRRLIREALKVADVAECCQAIDGCFASDFHMKRGRFKDRPGPKHNALSKIIKGKRGGRTSREQIDFFVEIAEKAGVGAGVTSADPAKVRQEQVHVRTGLAPGATEHLRTRGKEAATWLAQHGIETLVDDRGAVRFEARTGGTT